MRDRTILRKVTCLILALGLSWATTSCGGNGAANNDQGMSVTFLGLFSSNSLTGSAGGGSASGGATCGRLPAGISGGYIRLGQISYIPPTQSGTTSTTTNNTGTDPAGGYVSVLGLQNNLYGQAFRTERVMLDYFIPGANAQPPSTSVPLSTILGPAESALQGSSGSTGGGTGSGSGGSTTNSPTDAGLRRPLFTSLPPTFSNICNRSLAEVTIVPPSIREWLNFNRDLLPPAPFKMEVIIRVSGISSSGNRYDTNDGVFDFDVLAEDSIDPTVIGGTTTPTPSAAAMSNDGNVGDLAKLF